MQIFRIGFVATLLTAPAFAQIEGCASTDQPGGLSGSLANSWRRIQRALELERPREVQRLVAIRLKVLDLATAKKRLIGNVRTIVDVGSTPGWLQTRVQAIPQMQNQIQQLMEDIREEALQGGLLAGGATLRILNDVLATKRAITLCELSRIPFPLPSDKFSSIKALLAQLEDEAKSLEEIDHTFGDLIKRAQGSN